MALKMDNVIFDWRLYEQQGLPSYLHRHDQSKWVQQCELQFLKKMMDESNFTPTNAENEEPRVRSAASHRHKSNHHHHHHHHHHHAHNQQQSAQSQMNAQSQQQQQSKSAQMGFSMEQASNAQPQFHPSNPTNAMCCEFCGRPYCDQPDHPACKQQHLECDQQRQKLAKEREQYQHRSRSAAAHRSSRSRSMERSQTALHTHSNSASNGPSGKALDEQQLRSQLHTPPQFVLNTESGSSFECVGGVRKAGFLSVKKWLLRKRQHVELARKRGWKCYWACLKGTTLIFYHIGYEKEEGATSSLSATCNDCIRSRRCPIALGSAPSAYSRTNEGIYENLQNSSQLPWCSCSCHHQQSSSSSSMQKHHSFELSLKDNSSSRAIAQPKHLILVDGCIVQPIPEHPKREHVFCLSSAVGDAYLFQCPCDNELMNWVDAIQSACGAAIARSRGRAGAVAKLTTEIGCMQSRLERAARRKLSLEQQLGALLEQVHAIGGVEALASAVTSNNVNQLGRSAAIGHSNSDCTRLLAALRDLQSQLTALELQLEREHCEQFRLRCYVSSMQRSVNGRIPGQPLELPNPKMLLTHVSKQTKHVLNRLGIFNVSSLHAYTCARSPQLLNSLLLNLSQQMQHSAANAAKTNHLYMNQAKNSFDEDQALFRVAGQSVSGELSSGNTTHLPVRRGSQVRLQVIVPPPGPTVHDLLVDGGRTVEQLIEQLLGERRAQLAAQWRRLMRAQQLPTSEFFVCCKLVGQSGYFVPDSKLRIDRLPPIQHMRLMRKQTVKVRLQRISTNAMFGFSVEAHCSSNESNEKNENSFELDYEKQRSENNHNALNESNRDRNASKNAESCETNVMRVGGRLQVFVCKVEPDSEAGRQGLKKGDELLQLNGASVAELDMMFVECVLQEELCLNLVLRCARLEEQQAQKTIENTQSDSNGLFAGLDIYETFDSIQSIDRPGSALRPYGRCYSGGSEQQVRVRPPRRHSEHVLGENSTSDHLEDEYALADNSEGQMFDHSLADDYIDSLVCPPPPQDAALSDELIDKLIIPKPDQIEKGKQASGSSSNGKSNRSRLDSVGDLTENLMKSVQQVKAQLAPKVDNSKLAKPPAKANRSGKVQAPQPPQLITTVVEVQVHDEPDTEQQVNLPISVERINKAPEVLQKRRKSEELPKREYNCSSAVVTESESSGNENQKANREKKHSLTDCEKTHRVICELLDTEMTYVNHLERFKQMYLIPIRQQNILSSIDSLALFGPTDDVLKFQNSFLEMLRSVVEKHLPAEQEAQVRSPNEYKNVLIQLSKLFLYHTSQFRLYSVFCSAHSKAQKLLFNKESPNIELQDFVKRTSNGEKANSLETFLIKPIQRILKYPLLLQQLRDLSLTASVENEHLSAALKAMEKVAEHINEMQRINEEFGHVLDSLQRTHFKSTRQLISVGPTQLLYYDQVYWRNAPDYLGKLKKSVDLYSMCFVFSSSVVFFCMEKNKQKKKTNMRDLLDTVRYQILMPINEVQVRAIRQDAPPSNQNGNGFNLGDETVPPFQWELIHLKCSLTSANTQKRTEKVFQLANNSSTFRNVFLRTIRRLIRESVRNLSLPSKLTSPNVDHSSIDSKESHKSKLQIDLETIKDVDNDEDSEAVDNKSSEDKVQQIGQMNLSQLLEKQLQLRYFNASTLIRHLEETNGFEEEDKSCSSEK